jgi:hypothetical protein
MVSLSRRITRCWEVIRRSAGQWTLGGDIGNYRVPDRAAWWTICCMGGKKPRPKSKKEAGPAEVARAAGCSKQLASRLLKRGFAEAQIVERVAERKAREAARAATTNSHRAPALVNGLPSVVIPFPSFAESEAKKEHFLAELRGLQVMRERGELVRTCDVRLFCARLLVEARDILEAGPSELADTLAAEADPARCEAIVRAWTDRAVEKFHRLTLWSERPAGPEAA